MTLLSRNSGSFAARASAFKASQTVSRTARFAFADADANADSDDDVVDDDDALHSIITSSTSLKIYVSTAAAASN